MPLRTFAIVVSRVYLPPGWAKLWWFADDIQYDHQHKLQKKAPPILFGKNSRPCRFFYLAHSTAKCNGESFGVEENLTRSSIAEYLSGTRVEFILDPLDIGIGHNREI